MDRPHWDEVIDALQEEVDFYEDGETTIARDGAIAIPGGGGVFCITDDGQEAIEENEVPQTLLQARPAFRHLGYRAIREDLNVAQKSRGFFGPRRCASGRDQGPRMKRSSIQLHSVGALQPGMAKWLLDPYQEAGVPFGLLGWSAPRTHARSEKRTRGRHWFLLDADTQNGHQCMKQHNTSLVSTCRVQKHRMAGHFHTLLQTCSIVVLRQQQQNTEVNGNKWRGVHPARFACWRWEQDFELSYGRSTRDDGENAINVGWNATAQQRPEWRALEHTF